MGEEIPKLNYREIFRELSNQGRWGDDDQRGTLNYINPAKVKEALGLVRSGRVVSIGRDLDTVAGPSNPRPVVHQLLYAGHHAEVGHGFYGDRPARILCHPPGCSGSCLLRRRDVQRTPGRLSRWIVSGMRFGAIEAMAEGVVTRGVLLDVASAMGVDYLDPTAMIGPGELEAAEQYGGVTARKGDAVVVRSGRMVHEAQDNPPDPGHRAGLDMEAVRWLHRRQVAVYGGDCIEKLPSPYPGLPLPLHSLGLAGMGLALLDWPDTEALRSACSEEGPGRVRADDGAAAPSGSNGIGG